MKITPLFLSVTLLCAGPLAYSAKSRSESTITLCERSISKKFEITIHESISDSGKDYKEYEGLKYGYLDNRRAFVKYKGTLSKIEDIKFFDRSGKAINLKSESVALDLGDLYVRHARGGTIYCIVAPFSGMGSSGSFQRYAALIAIKATRAKTFKPLGAVVKRF